MCRNISPFFIYFLAFDPNTTDFLHTWEQTNSIFHVLRCRLIDLMLLVVRLCREKEHAYFFSFSLSNMFFFLFIFRQRVISYNHRAGEGHYCTLFPNAPRYRMLRPKKFLSHFQKSVCVPGHLAGVALFNPHEHHGEFICSYRI